MLKTMLAWHLEHYPHMQALDIVKLIFQAYRGCGHLLGPEEAVAARITGECASLQPSATEALTEPIGERYVRLNLRRAMYERLPALWIARMMRLSCKDAPHGTIQDVITSVNALANDVDSHAAYIVSAVRPLVENPDWLPNHSAEYHANYAPAYRVIEKKYVYLLPVLCEAAKTWNPQSCIAIDGRCGSGKSTLAKYLADIIGAPVVSMDDYFTPHSRKTPERLALPGGNADVERFCSEVLTPWQTTGHITYRPYNCQLDALDDPVSLTAENGLIVEGSYCLHPLTGRPYDVSVFMSVPYDEQCRRILARNGDWMLNRFINEWIPLEEAYFSAFSLPDDDCILLDQPSHN